MLINDPIKPRYHLVDLPDNSSQANAPHFCQWPGGTCYGILNESVLKPWEMLVDIFSRIQRIDYLIRIKGTGNATELADKLGISRASIYEYLSLMKHLGAPIKYSSSRKSFYYDEDGCFPTRFQFNRTTEDKNIAGVSAVICAALLSSFF